MSEALQCAKCGAAVEAGLRFCPDCGEPLAVTAAPTVSRGGAPEVIEWDHTMRLVQNPFMIYDMMKVWGLASLAPLLLIAGLGFWEGNYTALAMVGKVCVGIFLGFLLLSALIMVLLFRNRYPLHYSIDTSGIGMASRSVTASRTSTLAILLGLLGGRSGLTTAGAGFLAKSGETAHLPWKDLEDAHYYPERHAISLMNDWRVVVRMEMPPALYPQVETKVRAAVEKNQRKRGLPQRRATPAPLRAILTLLAILFGWALLGDEKPLVVPGALVLLAGIAAIVAMWADKGASRIAAAVALAVTLGSIGYALFSGGFENQDEPHWTAAFWAELLLFSLYAGIGAFVWMGRLRSRPTMEGGVA